MVTRRVAAMLGKRLVIMLASVLSTTVTPVRTARFRQRVFAAAAAVGNLPFVVGEYEHEQDHYPQSNLRQQTLPGEPALH